LRGNIPILDVQYGNVWTNIDRDVFNKLSLSHGDEVRVVIREDVRVIYDESVPYVATFGDVPEGEPLLYLNSLNNVALALNQGDFASDHGIRSGPAWEIQVTR
jgi:S-adenosylmethionine hydrolase